MTGKLITRSEDKLLFLCTRQTFQPRHQALVAAICQAEAVRWDLLYTMARVHGVAPLVYTNLAQCASLELGMPPNIQAQFKRSLASQIVHQARQAEKITQVLAFCQRHSIAVMLIKGAALDILVYHQPWYTVSNDVDFIVKPKKEALSEPIRTALRATRHGLPSECNFFEHHDVTMQQTLSIDFQRIWADALKIKFKGHDLFVMAPEDMLITACINSCRKRYFRLKALSDIQALIEHYPHLDWETLIAKARAYRCDLILYTALLVTQMTLGCDLPPGRLDDLAPNPLRRTIIHSLSRRVHRASLAALHSGRRILGRPVDGSLLLQYASLHWHQIWRRRTRFIQKRERPELELNIEGAAR